MSCTITTLLPEKQASLQKNKEIQHGRDLQSHDAAGFGAPKSGADVSDERQCHATGSSDTALLLNGFAMLSNYLLDAEADYLCGVPRGMRSSERRNHRTGYYRRMIITKIGRVTVQVPYLRHLHARPSMVKRFKRLQDDFIRTLRKAYKNGAAHACLYPLVQALWTVDLPDELHAKLTHEACVLLEIWRKGDELADNQQPHSNGVRVSPALEKGGLFSSNTQRQAVSPIQTGAPSFKTGHSGKKNTFFSGTDDMPYALI